MKHKHAPPKPIQTAAAPTYPPFVSESQAQTDDTAEVDRDLTTINRSLAPNVVTSFTATIEDGLPQFNFIVDQNAWDAVPEDTRQAGSSRAARYLWKRIACTESTTVVASVSVIRITTSCCTC